MTDSKHSCCGSDGSSCERTAAPAAKARANCPRCGHAAAKVGLETMESLLLGSARERIEDKPYYFCSSPECELVYFTSEGDRPFLRKELSVRVGVKETEDPIPLCYCFGHTRASVREEIARTGTTTVIQRISAEVKAGRCECEVKNPSGQCCLPQVKHPVPG